MEHNKNAAHVGGVSAHLVIMASAIVMASSADLRAAVGMSALIVAATILSTLTISALDNLIPQPVKLPANLLVITGFVSLLNMLMQAFFPVAVNLLGVHMAALAACPVLICSRFWASRKLSSASEIPPYWAVSSLSSRLYRDCLVWLVSTESSLPVEFWDLVSSVMVRSNRSSRSR